MSECTLCPRKCNVDRDGKKRGFCSESNTIRVARIAPHMFEEPCISGKNGSGTVFFSGCMLRCVFCQNKDISRPGGIGKSMSENELYAAIISLQEKGVHNINLVSPTHFAHKLIPILERLKASGNLTVPIVYNSSGYESVDTLKRLEGLVDIYMPDFKYFSSEIAKKYSQAPDYQSIASKAIVEMLRQTGRYKYSLGEPNILKSGVIVRHLVLPSCRKDSLNVIRHLSEIVDPKDILLSIMSQYTPSFAMDCPYSELKRRITSFEYSSVVDFSVELGFEGFTQKKTSAVTDYTPDFTM